jgi:hypothetical protein
MAKRLTAIDYSNAYNEIKENLSLIEKDIERRFLELCKRFPFIVLYQTGIDKEKSDVLSGWFPNDNPKRVPSLNTEAMIRFIAVIEKYLVDQQITINN